MDGFTLSSFRLARAVNPFQNAAFVPSTTTENPLRGGFGSLSNDPLPPHSQHPDFGHLVLLVFEAVLEVVCVSLPGYIVARQGMFDADSQKFLANLNVQLFTPCLIFTKLASQLTAEKLVELAIIPVIFVIQTLVSFLCSTSISKLFRFPKRAQNFVTAMGVFGNSNSLPISLVISLSKTLSGLHWDKIPGDNDDEVAARGILYLLIFQQLGQLLRWSWGYRVLLAPPDRYDGTDEERDSRMEGGSFHDEPSGEEAEEAIDANGPESTGARGKAVTNSASEYTSGTATPMNGKQYVDSERDSDSICSCNTSYSSEASSQRELLPTSVDGNVGRDEGNGHSYAKGFKKKEQPKTWRGQVKRSIEKNLHAAFTKISDLFNMIFSFMPVPAQKALSTIGGWIMKFLYGLWEFMNPPLWAMLAAIVVASFPTLQHLFFDHGTFINNSVTRAVAQSGGVAIPLILVVLGANLARNTLPRESLGTDDPKLERNLLIASLVCRMLLPTVIMAPILALMAKYVPISILDDPIFVIVCFLLTGAPSALQLAQICQINNVYMGAMSRILFQSYVIWILPSTLILVMLALEVVEWAGR